jgi:ankyrin repeat protein
MTKSLDSSASYLRLPIYFRPAERSLSGKLIEKLEKSSFFCQPLCEQNSRIACILIRVLAGIALTFTALIDFLGWAAFSIIVYPAYNLGAKDHFSNAISSIALSVMGIFVLSAGYLPATSVRGYYDSVPEEHLIFDKTSEFHKSVQVLHQEGHFDEPRSIKAHLLHAFQQSDLNKVKYIIENVKIAKSMFRQETSLFHFAYKPYFKCAEIIEYLLSKKIDPNVVDDKGNTVISLAAHYKEFDIVAHLLKYGARVDIPNKKGILPLTAALLGNDFNSPFTNYKMENRIKMAEILIESGAEFNKEKYELDLIELKDCLDDIKNIINSTESERKELINIYEARKKIILSKTQNPFQRALLISDLNKVVELSRDGPMSLSTDLLQGYADLTTKFYLNLPKKLMMLKQAATGFSAARNRYLDKNAPRLAALLEQSPALQIATSSMDLKQQYDKVLQGIDRDIISFLTMVLPEPNGQTGQAGQIKPSN